MKLLVSFAASLVALSCLAPGDFKSGSEPPVAVDQPADTSTVCITKTGKRYHRCYHYRGRNYPLTITEARERGYTPCQVCKPPAEAPKPRRTSVNPPLYRQP